MKIRIYLNKMKTIRRFAEIVSNFTSDVNISKGSQIYDAKSLLALFVIDGSNGLEVQMITDDIDELKEFREAMKEFESEDK